VTICVEAVKYTLAAQHRRTQTLMQDVLLQEGLNRQEAFDALRRFLAAHEAAEEEGMHFFPAIHELQGQTRK
jgi:hypothetical protein